MIKYLLISLIKFGLVILTNDAEKLLKARFISESDENYPKGGLHMHAENEPAMERNEAVLNDLPGELYAVLADDKVPDNCKNSLTMIEAAQNLKQTNTGGFSKVA